ncbi:P-loop containing nucleoside triphosphate hydrolase protein [Pilobolus umbonatus]|nr:P-loop containing nucleoside triphosphate hydrolase protein [Pilobolus umbonatus]
MSARDRRLSYIPPRPSVYQRSPTTPSLLKSLTNKPKRPKFLDEPIPEPTEPLLERPPIRHLNTYGIPIARNRKITSTDTAMLSNAFESTLHIKSSNTCKYSPNSIDMNPRIRVCVRKRPLNKKESMQNETDIISITGTRTVEVNASKVDVALNSYMVKHSFTFDEAFDNTISNDQIYTRTARPLVDYVFKGGNATCFAHGQTGSGKTYTMLHPEHGLYILAARDIFKRLSSAEYSHLTAVLGFYEIYQGKLFDLLNTRALLNARDDGNGNVVIGNLTECPIGNVNQLMEIFEYGNQSRTTGKTGANNNSSRSHAVLQILLKSNTGDKGIHGKLSFIDLAGSERGADRGDTTGQTRREGAEINKSLLALKECIRALDQDQKHAPFRGSKLTQVLKDSFTGSSRTCMIATISPCQNNSEHTLNTLRYADRYAKR